MKFINQLSRLILTYAESFMKIWLHLSEIQGFEYCHKWHACFHALCVQSRTCTPTNIIIQLRRPILTYAESFVNILLHLAEIWGFVYCPKFCAWFHALCVHTCMYTSVNLSGRESRVEWERDRERLCFIGLTMPSHSLFLALALAWVAQFPHVYQWFSVLAW